MQLTCGLASVGADVLFLIFCSLVIFCSGLKILLSAIVVIFIFGNFIGLTFRAEEYKFPHRTPSRNVISHFKRHPKINELRKIWLRHK